MSAAQRVKKLSSEPPRRSVFLTWGWGGGVGWELVGGWGRVTARVGCGLGLGQG